MNPLLASRRDLGFEDWSEEEEDKCTEGMHIQDVPTLDVDAGRVHPGYLNASDIVRCHLKAGHDTIFHGAAEWAWDNQPPKSGNLCGSLLIKGERGAETPYVFWMCSKLYGHQGVHSGEAFAVPSAGPPDFDPVMWWTCKHKTH